MKTQLSHKLVALVVVAIVVAACAGPAASPAATAPAATGAPAATQAPAGQPKPGGTLKVVMSGTVDRLDPALAFTFVEWMVADTEISQGLMKI